MKDMRYAKQITAVPKTRRSRVDDAESCRQHGITEQTYYRCRAKHGGMESGDSKKLKYRKDENWKPKHVVAELTLDNLGLKDVLSRNWKPLRAFW